jgi:hypothetical protein
MRTPSANAKREEGLKSLITATTKLWRSHHLSYDQARYVAKEVRRAFRLNDRSNENEWWRDSHEKRSVASSVMPTA